MNLVVSPSLYWTYILKVKRCGDLNNRPWLGLASHILGGFDKAAAYPACGVDPAGWTAMAAFVVGHVGDPATLPEKLRERELLRSPRKPAVEVARAPGA